MADNIVAKADRSADFVKAQEIAVQKGGETGALALKRMSVMRMAVKRDSALEQSEKCVFVPMIAVNMRQDGGAHIAPSGADFRKATGQASGPNADVEQESEVARPQQAGVAGTAAGQDAKAHTKPDSSINLPRWH